MKDKVSVVVTCYNHEKYIEQCLTSIFKQTYKNIELLVINDGSTDDSEEIIRKVIPSSPFKETKYYTQTNQGICITRNKALGLITGSFLLFVDSDNFLDDTYVEQLLRVAIETGKDILYGNLVNPDNREVFMEAKPYSLSELLAGNYIDNCSLVRVSKIGEARYDIELNRKKLVDYDFMLNLIINQKAEPYYVSDANLNYRVLPDSLSRKKNERQHFEIYVYILGKYLNNDPKLSFNALANNLFVLEDRLGDLIEHLNGVTEFLLNLKEENKNLNEQVDLKEKKLVGFQKSNLALKEQVTELALNKSLLEQENQVIRLSKSYKIGNFIVRSVKRPAKIIRNPKLIRPYLGKIKRKIQKYFAQRTSLKGYVQRPFRFFKRKNNNYTQPDRLLIYVIYENQEQLQDYKMLFLKALATLSKKVYIVVNGKLNSNDKSELEKIGNVMERSNSGYDTAAFRYGIHAVGKDELLNYDELLLVNDTNVGPMADLALTFEKMAKKKLDFWGISYGEAQPDFTGYNPYKYVPIHLQSYFLVIEKSMLASKSFYRYWDQLTDTNSRNKAIGKHETVFTKYFSDRGFTHGAVVEDCEDSAMYIHPLEMLKKGVPLVKYTAFTNYDSDSFAWKGLQRESEVPALLDYIKDKNYYPFPVIEKLMQDIKSHKPKQHILIIDGVENIIPQCTRYRVLNKAEQLESLGYVVWHVNRSGFSMEYAQNASHIIIYRSGATPELQQLCELAKKANKPVLFDIDDLVIDTKYTDQLGYTQGLSPEKKADYDLGVKSYGKMMSLCDGIITSTGKMKEELLSYNNHVYLNRNLASLELVEISKEAIKRKQGSNKVKIGYFSGSIAHNENFELIKPAILKILTKYSQAELHLVGYLDLPQELEKFKGQIKQHKYVDWKQLPALISGVDINLAPLTQSIFNEAKSEIKWIEASLVKVPTIASNIGSFKEMIKNNETGLLVNDDEWFEALDELISFEDKRNLISEKAYETVLSECITENHMDEFSNYLK